MDVRCDKCGAEYELDESRVSAQGVNVKCTSCAHVFRVSKAAAATRAQTSGDWMIRQTSGQIFKFKELTTLQRWIVERRVLRDDEISKTGETWKRLGDILELSSFFQVAEQAAIVPLQHGLMHETPSGRIMPTRRSQLPAVMATSVVLLALITGAFLMRATIAGWFEDVQPAAKATQGNELASSHVARGRAALKQDTVAAYSEAEAEFEKALQLQPNDTAALAGATYALAGAADYAREDAADIEATLKATAEGKIKLAPSEIAGMASELGRKQADAAARTERAFAYMKRTLEADQTQREGLRAAARYYALTRAPEAFESLAEKAKGAQDDPELAYALGLLRRLDETQLDAAAQAFQRTLEKEPDHLGARFRLAEIFVKRGEQARALPLLLEVLERVPDHAHALALKMKITPASAEAKAEEPAQPSGPETFDAIIRRADRARKTERSKQALELYGRALEMRPGDVEALTGLGFVYLDMNQATSAIAQFQRATAANDHFSDAYMGLAEAYRARGQKRDAVKNYQRYLELTPDGAEANVVRQALEDLGQ